MISATDSYLSSITGVEHTQSLIVTSFRASKNWGSMDRFHILMDLVHRGGPCFVVSPSARGREYNISSVLFIRLLALVSKIIPGKKQVDIKNDFLFLWQDFRAEISCLRMGYEVARSIQRVNYRTLRFQMTEACFKILL